MRLRKVVAFIFVFALAFAAIFLPVAGSTVQANDRCKAFHAFVQGVLPTPNQFAPTDTWGGPIFGNLDSGFLQGGISGNDGTEYPHGPFSIFKDGLYKACLTSGTAWGGPNDCLDSFTYKAQAFVIWPAGDSLGSYKATAKIVNGTNRFASASGHLEIEGPFILWPDPNSVFGVSGRWNGELNGRICGVQ
jgi:hypothetical protein